MRGNRISPNFTFEEFTYSDTAKAHHINNAITDWDVRDNIIALVQNILQPARDAWGEPMFVNSGFRCWELNALVGGEDDSQHPLGQAADIRVSDTYKFAQLILFLRLPFDQMGVNNSYVHLSYKKEGKNRGEIYYYEGYRGPKDL